MIDQLRPATKPAGAGAASSPDGVRPDGVRPDTASGSSPLATPPDATLPGASPPDLDAPFSERFAHTTGTAASPAASGVLSEGSRFGVYSVGNCIGEGGMARVYRAEHEGLKRQVALKVLSDGLGQGSEGHERFLREARIAAGIKHPNVVNIFDVGVHGGTPFLVMELLEGLDLEAFVQSKGRLDEGTIMDIIVPIAAALAAVHDAGIVHRDLKPGNIFLARGRNEEIEPRLLDFGISKSFGPNQLKLTSGRCVMLGTPFYISPEGARGAEMTPLSDQYALGVVLYECATGINPFAEATTFADVVRRVTLGEYPPVALLNPLVSRRMVAIIERAMQLDPARRFPDMRALGRQLLLLAGQRTRVTWGLSFTELISESALARVAAPHDEGLPKDEARPRRARARYAPPLAMLLVAAFGLSWGMREDEQRGQRHAAATVEAAPSSGDVLTRALRPEPSGEASRPTAPLAAVSAADDAALAGDDVIQEVAPARRDETLANGRALRVREALGKASKPDRLPSRKRAGEKRRSAPANEPEWLAPAQGGESGPFDATLGTNNAPIFD